MKRKILASLMVIALSLSIFVFPPTTVNAVTVIETCSLPMDRHNLIHTFPDCPMPGDSLRTDTCSVCGIAKRTAGMQSFHPSGAPAGVTASQYICTYANMDKGVASEKCSMSNCTGTGPHGICACGQLVAVGQPHQRTYDKTGIGFTRIQTKWGDAKVDVRKGDIIVVSASTNASDVPVTMTLDGVVVVDSEDYLGEHYVVEHDGHMTLEDRYGDAQYYHLSPYDTNGTKYNIPSVLGGQQFYADQLYPYAQYNDGVYMMGSDKYSKRFTRYHSRFMTHIPANTIVTMECNDGNSHTNIDARLCILDSAYNIVYSRSKSNAHTGTVIAVTVKEEGDYWIMPEYYWTYVDEETTPTSISHYPNGMVTIRFNGLVSPEQKDQVVYASLSLSQIGYGSTPPTLNVSDAKTTLSYTSSNPSVATISSLGIIEIKGLGSTTFTISAEETSAWKAAKTTVTLTVTKGNLTVKTKPTAGSISYGQQLSASSLSNGTAINASGSVVGGGWSFKSPLTYPNAGTTAYAVRFIPTDTVNYNY